MINFGSKEHPLRCSSLPMLVKCPWRAVLLAKAVIDDESGVAADTGSALHAAVAAWHTNGQDAQSARESMLKRMAEFPRAIVTEANGMFKEYCTDPRNKEAKIILCEEKVEFTIPAHPTDRTGNVIHVQGTVDQVRLMRDGRLLAWDVKTSKRNGRILMDEHALQVAGYAKGATLKLGKPVYMGGLITTRPYMERGVWAEKSPDGIFWEYPFELDEIDTFLESVRLMTAIVRNGDVFHNPGDYCGWCPMLSSMKCLPLLHKEKSNGKKISLA